MADLSLYKEQYCRQVGARQNRMAEQLTDLVGDSQAAEDSLAVDSNLAEADIGQVGIDHLEGSCAGLQDRALGRSRGPSRPCRSWEVHWVQILHQMGVLQEGAETANAYKCQSIMLRK